MVALIERLRKVIGDTGSPPVFEDDELQAALDERRYATGGLLLTADAALSGSPTVFRSALGFWESDAVIATGNGTALTVDATRTDPTSGVWSFTGAPGVDVYVVGSAFDFWAAAADLLEQWAARLALDFDFVTDGQRFDRSQKREGLLLVAREFGRRARRIA